MVQIEERMAGHAAVLAVSGDITMGGGSRYHVVLDMTRVRYVDKRRAKNRSGALKLVHVGPRLRDLLVMSRVLSDAYDSEDDALASSTLRPLPR